MQITAEAMNVSTSAVKITMRNIREAGKLTTGAHGVNAPDMCYLDAARILIAQIIEDSPGRRAPVHVEEIGALPWANPAYDEIEEPFKISALLPDADTGTFEQALAALLRVFAECRDTEAFEEAGMRLHDGRFQLPQCRVEIFPRDQAARISMGRMHYDFFRLARAKDWTPDSDERFRLGAQRISFVNQEVIARIAEGFEEGEG
ncbi:hypothetical protein [Rhodovulum sp. P5]|uniref:hypothetical protein n=1 Tax=Rhodovulum sp. P5 TaxID=1564506 RepID=UPI0012EB8F14|nr:hypothetical protein [Rhodovulum sp. P5]